MICKDCKPSNGEIRDSTVGAYYVYEGVELCERHAEMEQKLATLEALFANVEDEQRERRRYALLQASAVLMTRALSVQAESETLVVGCVEGAEWLLAEIEKREAREAKG
jgi:hypothetical protein